MKNVSKNEFIAKFNLRLKNMYVLSMKTNIVLQNNECRKKSISYILFFFFYNLNIQSFNKEREIFIFLRQ